jgi:hypothetical protein
MGGTACTEPQCLYKGALYLTFTMPNAAFSKKNVLFRQETGIKSKEETTNCNIWNIALCGTEN